MKNFPFLLVPAVAFFGAACERHSADSLPGHGHGGGHGSSPAGKVESKEHPAAKSAPEKTLEKKEVSPAAGQAPKFFEEKKAEDKKNAQ